MEFDGLFWIVFLMVLLWTFVSGGVGIAFLLAFSVAFVRLCFFLVFDKRFCLRILSGWVAGREKKVVLERGWGR